MFSVQTKGEIIMQQHYVKYNFQFVTWVADTFEIKWQRRDLEVVAGQIPGTLVSPEIHGTWW